MGESGRPPLPESCPVCAQRVLSARRRDGLGRMLLGYADGEQDCYDVGLEVIAQTEDGREIKAPVATSGSGLFAEHRCPAKLPRELVEGFCWLEARSSNVRRLARPRAEDVYVQFHGGGLYRYSGLQEKDWEQLREALNGAGSVGRAVNGIKARLACVKVELEDENEAR